MWVFAMLLCCVGVIQGFSTGTLGQWRRLQFTRHVPVRLSVTTQEEGSGSVENESSDKNVAAKSSRWDSFDYLQHWYPVVWACDVLPNTPLKVTLFDVDYVIAHNAKTGQWTALQDQCPHKAAALSEGRLTESGFFQCAYHGWSFNGTTGDCVQIPQQASVPLDHAPTYFPPRSCAKALPIREHQTMVWLWPGPRRQNDEDYPDPPSIPEFDMEGWKVTRVIRDFPMVDWPLLVSNILDPDHGAFAHQNLAFDWYAASAKYPLTIHESFDNAGWIMQAAVPAVDKVLAVDRAKRQLLGLKTKTKEKAKRGDDTSANTTVPMMANSVFMAPTTVTLCRRDANGNTKFVTAFWVCPTGTGKSRFMSAAISKSKISIPRWLVHLNLNRFLDQDTVLVASQQPPVLSAEAQGIEKPRASLFAYGSASDKTVRRIDNFWDATLPKVPNRSRALQQLYQSGALQQTPPREIVLDRRAQHLNICPDSQQFVRNCRRITRGSMTVGAVWIGKALWQRTTGQWWVPAMLALVACAASQLRSQFYFVKTEASRNSDLSKIPVKIWLDP